MDQTPEVMLRVWRAYKDWAFEGFDWLRLCEKFRDGFLLTHEHGWLWLGHVIPGVKAEIHAGKWPEVVGPEGALTFGLHTKRVVDSFMRHHELRVLLTFTPDSATAIQRLLVAVGFKLCGVVPYDGVLGGEWRNSLIYAYEG